jgi:hypothetical protein
MNESKKTKKVTESKRIKSIMDSACLLEDESGPLAGLKAFESKFTPSFLSFLKFWTNSFTSDLNKIKSSKSYSEADEALTYLIKEFNVFLTSASNHQKQCVSIQKTMKL